MTKYGYGRVSTADQTTDTQREALIRAGVEPENVFTEKTSGVKRRPELEKLLLWLQPGDELIVTKLDRLGRNLRDLQDIAAQLEAKGVSLNIGGNVYDPKDPFSKVFFSIMAAFAEFERDLIAQRTTERLTSIRESGGTLGRPSLVKPELEAIILSMVARGFTKTEIAKATKLSRATVYRVLRNQETADEIKNDPLIQRQIHQDKIASRKRREKELAKFTAQAEALREQSASLAHEPKKQGDTHD